MTTIVYTFRGDVERGTGQPGYRWHRGYSETTPDGAVLYPWQTIAECRADARARGAVAVFVQPKPAAPPEPAAPALRWSEH